MKLKKIIHNFKNGIRGLAIVTEERNFKIILLVGLVALLFAVILPLRRWEVITVLFLIGFVVSVEMINSKLERILDLVNPTYDRRVKNIKDISAGAVLVASLTSAVLGLKIFIPYLLEILN